MYSWPCLSGLVGNPNGITTAGLSFGRSRQLPCVFETSKIVPLTDKAEITRLNVRLVLSRAGSRAGQRSQPENLPPDNIPSFIVQGEFSAQVKRARLAPPQGQKSHQHPARRATDLLPGIHGLHTAASSWSAEEQQRCLLLLPVGTRTEVTSV